MPDMPGCRVEVAWGTPPGTRPADVDFARIDSVAPLRALTTRRGVRIKTAEIETGEAVGLFDNRARSLDPANTGSPWAPNVKPRRRIRYVLEPEGEAERKLFTGFIDRLPTGWEVGDGWVEVTAVDLLALIAGDSLPPSVLHVETVNSAPVGYWPMTEQSGIFVDDVVGNRDATLNRPVVSTVEVVPFDRRPIIEFKRADDNDPVGQRARIHPMRVTGTEYTLAAWVRMTGDVINSSWMQFVDEGAFPGTATPDRTRVSLGGVEDAGEPIVSLTVNDGTNFASIKSAPIADAEDKQPHRVIATISSAGIVRLWWDGVELPLHELSGSIPGYDLDASAVDLSLTASLIDTLNLGWGTNFGGSTINAAGGVGHVTYWDRVLTPEEIAADYVAGTNPWDGDRTDERLARILDMAGVDVGDRDLDQGTATCSPAVLDGGNLLEYLRKIVATEPGASLFVDPDGRIAFRVGVANDPAPLATFVGDPAIDAGTPYTDITPDYSIDRIINIAEVTRENGVTQRTENADSISEYRQHAVQLETLHRTASGARGAGARLTNRNPEPRLVFTDLELNARRDDVPPAVALDREVGDPVDVIARPTGGGDPAQQLSLIERVEHELDWRERTWVVGLGLIEHTVLPLLAWDTADRGWDQSVWPDT